MAEQILKPVDRVEILSVMDNTLDAWDASRERSRRTHRNLTDAAAEWYGGV